MQNWINIHQKLPHIKWVNENECEIENIRNCIYSRGESKSLEQGGGEAAALETEFSPSKINWQKEKYNLNDLKKVWFIENNYAKMQSHIMLSFEFRENHKSKYITVSAEVRKKGGEDFEIWHVLYKRFNIFYIFSKEEDIVFLRTNIRKSGVYLYELNLNQNEIKNLFKEICKNTNKVFEGENIIYKLFKTDCVNTMLINFTNAGIKVKKYFWDYSPTTVLSRSGLIKGEYKNLKEVFKKTFVNPKDSKIKSLKQDENYSMEIRKM
jgi:hypothetical protein